MSDKTTVSICTLDNEEVDKFVVTGICNEIDLLRKVILDIYKIRGAEANGIYKVAIASGEKAFRLRFVTIMDFKPTVLGVIDI